jgi:hypothetical protein
LNKTHIFTICATAILLLALFDLKVLSSHNWDPRAFILERSKEIPFSQKWGVGYDGQFTYLLATNPLGSTEGIDEPAYRYQRIIFPIVVRILSLNNPSVIPWMMIIINLAAAALACSALAWLLKQRGASPWLSLTVIFSLGYLLSVRMDLNEPLALALALLGWVLYERDKLALAILLFALSGLTKEVGLIIPIALSIWEGLNRNWKRCFAIGIGSIAPYLIWYGFLVSWFGVSQSQMDMSRPILIPFWGLHYLTDPPSQLIVWIWVMLPAIIGGVFAALDLWRSMTSRIGRDALLVLSQVGLIAILPGLSWADPLAVLRIALGLHITILVWLAGARPRLLPYAVALWIPSVLVLFLVPNML